MSDATLAHAHRCLEALTAATDDRQAWRSWRSLERAWDDVDPAGRVMLKAAARLALPDAPDGRRRLAVVEKLPD